MSFTKDFEQVIKKSVRRKWTDKEKTEILEETDNPNVNISSIARKYGIPPSQLFKWRKLRTNGKISVVRQEDNFISQTEFEKLKDKIGQLEQLLGRKTLENEILRETLESAYKRKFIFRVPEISE